MSEQLPGSPSNLPPEQSAASAPPPVPPAVNYESPGAGQYIPTDDEKTMAMLIWLLSIATGLVGPLILWLIKKDQSRFIDFHGKQVLNLEIGLMIISLIAIIPCIGILILLPIVIIALVYSIIGMMRAYKGEWYRCPFVVAIIK